MNSKEAQRLIRLKANLEKDLKDISQLQKEKDELGIEDTHPRILGSILHDFYTGIERIFQKIAEECDGGVPRSESWHKELLGNMSLELEGIRPPVITGELRRELEEYLGFRHVFRNIYGFQLESERLKRLLQNFDKVFSQFKNSLTRFIRFLKKLADEIDQE